MVDKSYHTNMNPAIILLMWSQEAYIFRREHHFPFLHFNILHFNRLTRQAKLNTFWFPVTADDVCFSFLWWPSKRHNLWSSGSLPVPLQQMVENNGWEVLGKGEKIRRENIRENIRENTSKKCSGKRYINSKNCCWNDPCNCRKEVLLFFF